MTKNELEMTISDELEKRTDVQQIKLSDDAFKKLDAVYQAVDQDSIHWGLFDLQLTGKDMLARVFVNWFIPLLEAYPEATDTQLANWVSDAMYDVQVNKSVKDWHIDLADYVHLDEIED